MNRPIKFRAWNNAEKKMYPEVEDIRERYETYLMQYTGLKDKNGKEIYEGDIICRRAMRNTFVEYERCRWVLRYDDPKVEWRQDLHNQISLHLEVIGNIYENPKLINKV